jgi:dTDP-4-dehydrorhamnose reductase
MRILVPGRNGQVGWELQAALAPLGSVVALDRGRMDLANADSIRRAIRDAQPAIIVNAAGYTNVDRAESEPGLAMQVNGVAPGIMAEEAKRLGALFVHYSTDYVFEGAPNRRYLEDDAPGPVNEYGRTKLAGEKAVQEVGGRYLVLRASWIYSARGSNFVLTILRLAREKDELPVVTDQIGSPTWARELAQATARLLARGDIARDRSGIYHLAAAGHTSRHEFASAIVETAREISGIATGWAHVKKITSRDYPPLPAVRPLFLDTSSDKVKSVFGVELPHWRDQLRACLRELGLPARMAAAGAGR